MMDDLRPFLYPLGLVSSIIFSVRVLTQWISSEVYGTSRVPPSFWYLSLVGNSVLLIHSVIQAQAHVALIQSVNLVIAWRNLDLMKPVPKQTFLSTLLFVVIALILTTISTAATSYAFSGYVDWIRVPEAPWKLFQVKSASFFLHLIGSIGLLLFNSRFWIQWWMAEKSGQSDLPPIFWWMSLTGALTSLFYFSSISDPVNLIGPLFGVVAYSRNLILIQRTS